MTTASLDHHHNALRCSVFAVLPEPELHRLAGEVHESRLLAGHLLDDPEVTVIAAGLVRAFIGDDTGRQVTVAYLRPGTTLALVHLAGRRYPTAFQAVEDSRLVGVGNDRARRLHETYPALGWATIRELSTRLDDLETGLAYFAFGSLRQRLAYHLLLSPPSRTGRPGRSISPISPRRSAAPARWSAAPRTARRGRHPPDRPDRGHRDRPPAAPGPRQPRLSEPKATHVGSDLRSEGGRWVGTYLNDNLDDGHAK